MIKIVPTVEIIEGKCARLAQGEHLSKIEYREPPLDVARRYEDAGLRYLYLMDNDGAKAERIVHYNILEKIATKTSLIVHFAGGIVDERQLQIAQECGAHKVHGERSAGAHPEILFSWIKKYGEESVILAVDVEKERVVTHPDREEKGIYLYDLVAQFVDHKGKYVACKEIAPEGPLENATLDLYKKLRDEVPDARCIVHGGVPSLLHLEKLAELPLEAVILDKALYEGKITLKDLSLLVRG